MYCSGEHPKADPPVPQVGVVPVAHGSVSLLRGRKAHNCSERLAIHCRRLFLLLVLRSLCGERSVFQRPRGLEVLIFCLSVICIILHPAPLQAQMQRSIECCKDIMIAN